MIFRKLVVVLTANTTNQILEFKALRYVNVKRGAGLNLGTKGKLKMKSKKALFKELKEIDPVYFKGVDLNHTIIGNETYGSKSMIYIQCLNIHHKPELSRELSKRGFKVCRYDVPTVLEVQVSYFKGKRWDE